MAHLVRVLCTLANAGELINGVVFAPTDRGMLSEQVPVAVAERFVSIPGYQIVDPDADDDNGGSQTASVFDDNPAFTDGGDPGSPLDPADPVDPVDPAKAPKQTRKK